MKPSGVKKLLLTAIKNRKNVLLVGAPGVGKTETVEQVCRKLGADIIILHGVIMQPIDAKGLPAIVNGKAVFLEYGDLEKMLTANKLTVVFFDDLGQATPAVQSSIMQIILQRQINGKKISDFVSFVAATNDKNQGANVGGIITPLLSRFSAIVPFEFDANEWTEWAFENDLDKSVIAFVNFKKGLMEFSGKNKNIENFLCPRTAYNLSEWIRLGVLDKKVWEGAIGKGFAHEFASFRESFAKIIDIPKSAILTPKEARVPQDLSQQFAIVYLLATEAKSDNVNNLLIYTKRISEEKQVLFTSLVTRRDKRLQLEPAIAKILKENRLELEEEAV